MAAGPAAGCRCDCGGRLHGTARPQPAPGRPEMTPAAGAPHRLAAGVRQVPGTVGGSAPPTAPVPGPLSEAEMPGVGRVGAVDGAGGAPVGGRRVSASGLARAPGVSGPAPAGATGAGRRGGGAGRSDRVLRPAGPAQDPQLREPIGVEEHADGGP